MEEKRRNDYGKKIKDARHKKNMSRKELARMIGVSQMSIFRWEHGLFALKYDTYKKLVQVLGLEL